MTSKIFSVTVDCANAQELAGFWSAVLERPVDQSQPGASEFFASIGRDSESGELPIMMFIKVPEGKSAKNRMHLDLGTEDRGAEVVRLQALGATFVHEKDEWGIQWSTLADPEGNEFCVAEHR